MVKKFNAFAKTCQIYRHKIFSIYIINEIIVRNFMFFYLKQISCQIV